MRLLQEGTLPGCPCLDRRAGSVAGRFDDLELRGQIGPEGQPAARMARPTSVTVFGISISSSAPCLMCTPLAIAALWIPGSRVSCNGSGHDGLYDCRLYRGFLCAILLLAAGIGLLYQKRWARQWSYGYGWFAIVWAIIGIIISVALMASGIQGSGGLEETAAKVGGVVGGMCGGIIGLIYPIILVVFMRRPNVVEACQK